MDFSSFVDTGRIRGDFLPTMPCFTSGGFIDPLPHQRHHEEQYKRPWEHGNELNKAAFNLATQHMIAQP